MYRWPTQIFSFVGIAVAAVALAYIYPYAHVSAMHQIFWYAGMLIVISTPLTTGLFEIIGISCEGITVMKLLGKDVFLPWDEVTYVMIFTPHASRRNCKTSMVYISKTEEISKGLPWLEKNSWSNLVMVQFREGLIQEIAKYYPHAIYGIANMVDDGYLDGSYRELEYRDVTYTEK